MRLFYRAAPPPDTAKVRQAASSALTLSGVLLNDGAITVEADNGSFTVDAVYDLTGTLSYWNGGGAVPDIDLVLSGSRLYRGISGSDGSYSVSGVPAGTYSLTPNGTSAPETGISAMDASLALRHQAGLQTLTGYALMAADVNRNGSVTAQDASYMLQRAAGLIGLPFQNVGVVGCSIRSREVTKVWPRIRRGRTSPPFCSGTPLVTGRVMPSPWAP